MANEEKILEMLAAIQQDVGTLKSDVGILKSDVETLKSDVGTLKSDINTIELNIKTLTVTVNENNQFVKAMRSELELINAKVDGLKVDTVSQKQMQGFRKKLDVGLQKLKDELAS